MDIRDQIQPSEEFWFMKAGDPNSQEVVWLHHFKQKKKKTEEGYVRPQSWFIKKLAFSENQTWNGKIGEDQEIRSSYQRNKHRNQLVPTTKLRKKKKKKKKKRRDHPSLGLVGGVVWSCVLLTNCFKKLSKVFSPHNHSPWISWSSCNISL